MLVCLNMMNTFRKGETSHLFYLWLRRLERSTQCLHHMCIYYASKISTDPSSRKKNKNLSNVQTLHNIFINYFVYFISMEGKKKTTPKRQWPMQGTPVSIKTIIKLFEVSNHNKRSTNFGTVTTANKYRHMPNDGGFVLVQKNIAQKPD